MTSKPSPRRVLIGTDGSARSADAVALGALLAPLLDARPVLLHAHRYGPPGAGPHEADYERHVHEVGEQVARHASALLDRSEPALMRLVADRSPAAALHRAAERADAVAIVIGSSHRGRIGRVLPGGVAQRLLSGAPCPVAVAPAGYATRPPVKITAVGCGFDGSPGALDAIDNAADLARHAGATLRVIAVQRWFADLAGELDRAVESCGLGDAVAPVLCDGDPAAVLALESRTLGLLVVGSRGYGPIGSVLIGSVAARLLHESACPVLVIPRGAGRRPRPSLAEQPIGPVVQAG